MNPEIVFSVRHRHVSSPGECGWLRDAGRPEVVTLSICYNWPVLFRAIHIHHSIAYSLTNISAKYRNRLMWVESIVCNISVVFWDTVYKAVTLQHRRRAIEWWISHGVIDDANAVYRYLSSVSSFITCPMEKASNTSHTKFRIFRSKN